MRYCHFLAAVIGACAAGIANPYIIWRTATKAVFASGRHVVECGQLTTLDVSKLISRVTEASNKIAEGLE